MSSSAWRPSRTFSPSPTAPIKETFQRNFWYRRAAWSGDLAFRELELLREPGEPAALRLHCTPSALLPSSHAVQRSPRDDLFRPPRAPAQRKAVVISWGGGFEWTTTATPTVAPTLDAALKLRETCIRLQMAATAATRAPPSPPCTAPRKPARPTSAAASPATAAGGRRKFAAPVTPVPTRLDLLRGGGEAADLGSVARGQNAPTPTPSRPLANWQWESFLAGLSTPLTADAKNEHGKKEAKEEENGEENGGENEGDIAAAPAGDAELDALAALGKELRELRNELRSELVLSDRERMRVATSVFDDVSTLVADSLSRTRALVESSLDVA